MRPVEVAKLIIQKLADNNVWVDTVRLKTMCGLDKELTNSQFRTVLSQLQRRDIVGKRGEGKFWWKLIREDYDKDNPFNTKPRSNKDPELRMIETTSSSGKYKVVGNTYQHRAALSAAGGKWDAVTKYWYFNEVPSVLRHLFEKGEYKEKDEAGAATKEETFKEDNSALQTKVDELEAEVAKLNIKIKHLDETRKVELIIKEVGKETKFEESTHPIMEQVMFHLKCGDNVMLVGPKGCGKTYLAKQAARGLNIACGMISLSGGVTEGKIFGRSTPNIAKGTFHYQSTQCVDLWEGGGLFLWDEVDAADPNVLLSLNGGLEDGELPVDRPKKPIAKRHKDFYAMAAANTWGNGADRQYCGRNQLDSAFIDRFVQIAMDYDKALELSLCPGWEEGVNKLHEYRDNLYKARCERVIGTRFIKRAYNWVQHGKDSDYVEKMLFAGWRDDEIRKVKGGY